MYLIDANVLIEAKNRYYAFDIAPGFWAWLDHAYMSRSICSIDAVRDELLEGNDELAVWADQHRALFLPMDAQSTAHFPTLAGWANSRQYTAAAIEEFTSNTADFYLIAFAKANGHVVVTHEQPKPDARKRVLIPDACIAMNVEFVDTFTMLRKTGAKLHFTPPSASG
ncbi:Uncharacterised protein [Nocardia otitidiscaviarum]|uniref:DUF4411 family protein n=1 Tax=Nocardia otitidiscaviarum TaxID=1823 RepID=A0A378YHN5_9NOCA|nr:DUF4411 family protein [Nocardia otitidiscaviarum]SUA75937.1 Uncharacterised protein [Nocardia otitidiscaviarum]